MTTQDPGLDAAELRALLDRKPLLTRTEALPLLDRLEAAEEALTSGMAEAWDEGYHRGVLDEVGDLERADNPYREQP